MYTILENKIIDYINQTPENTNPSVLATLLSGLNKQSDWNQNDTEQPDYVKNRISIYPASYRRHDNGRWNISPA